MVRNKTNRETSVREGVKSHASDLNPTIYPNIQTEDIVLTPLPYVLTYEECDVSHTVGRRKLPL